jgi:hypothetical protein
MIDGFTVAMNVLFRHAIAQSNVFILVSRHLSLKFEPKPFLSLTSRIDYNLSQIIMRYLPPRDSKRRAPPKFW